MTHGTYVFIKRYSRGPLTPRQPSRSYFPPLSAHADHTTRDCLGPTGCELPLTPTHPFTVNGEKATRGILQAPTRICVRIHTPPPPRPLESAPSPPLKLALSSGLSSPIEAQVHPSSIKKPVRYSPCLCRIVCCHQVELPSAQAVRCHLLCHVQLRR